MKKKLLALMLVVVMALGMSTTAMADYTDTKTVDLNKVYELTNDGTTSPAETFKFSIEKVGVTDSVYTVDNMPMFEQTEYTITFDKGEATLAGDTNATTLTLPTYDRVGVYTYKITEVAPETPTAGVVYNTKPLFLKVTAIEQNGIIRVAALHLETETGSKTENIVNTYQAGALAITKKVTGLLGDKNKYFDVKVTLTAPEGTVVNSEITVSGGSNEANPTSMTVGTETTLKVKDGDTITISNIPYGVTYTVVEADYTGEGYEAAVYSEFDGVINSASDSVEITNEKDTTVDTGINLDSMVYIAIIAVVAVAMVGIMSRRRMARR